MSLLFAVQSSSNVCTMQSVIESRPSDPPSHLSISHGQCVFLVEDNEGKSLIA